jgi:YD repeat-containing protein
MILSRMTPLARRNWGAWRDFRPRFLCHADLRALSHSGNDLDQASAQIRRYQYDANGRLTNRWSAAKGNTTYRYDTVGSLTNVVYASSPAIVVRVSPSHRPLLAIVDKPQQKPLNLRAAAPPGLGDMVWSLRPGACAARLPCSVSAGTVATSRLESSRLSRRTANGRGIVRWHCKAASLSALAAVPS